MRKVNVFTGVCLSFCSGGGWSQCDHYTWCIGPHCTGPLWPWPLPDMRPRTPGPLLLDIRPGTPDPIPHQTWDPPAPPHATDIWWSSLDTFLNLFILGYDWATSGGGHWSYYVCKRLLRILLECFLVLRYLFSWKDPWFKVNRNTSKAVIKYLRPYCRK